MIDAGARLREDMKILVLDEIVFCILSKHQIEIMSYKYDFQIKSACDNASKIDEAELREQIRILTINLDAINDPIIPHLHAFRNLINLRADKVISTHSFKIIIVLD